jgi:hypothetical protein
MKADADEVEVVASFEREDMDYLALDIEIKNRSAQPIDINPADFRMGLLNAARQPLDLAGMVNTRQAASPDYELSRMDYKVKKEQARLKRNKIINTVLLVAIVAADVAASSSPKRNSREWSSYVGTKNDLYIAFNALQVKRVIDHGSFANTMQRLQFEEYRWRELAMKRALVQPGESVRGFVYLPKVKEAAFLNLNYPTASGTSVQLLFEQTLSKARPK